MRVLLVEDDPVTARVISALAGSLGHQVVHAPDATAALDELARPPAFDVVLGDWYLPDLPGPELCRRIQDGGGAFVPFVYVSSQSDRDRQLEGMRAGAIGYLVKPVDRHELEMQLLAAERMLGLHRALEQRNRQLQRVVERLQLDARQDRTTGIPNRAHFDDDAPAFFNQARHTGTTIAFCMLDLDAFKAYNDRFGHPAGDAVLRRVALTLADTLRGSDRLYRYGGEEIAVLLTVPDAPTALRVTDRLREAVSALAIPNPGGPQPVVTLSAGVAVNHPGIDEPFASMVRRADRAMYAAKSEGRDRAALAPPPAVVQVGSLAALGDAFTACQAIRREVFVEGQGIDPAIDDDGRDPDALHALARVLDQPVGAARARPVPGAWKVERVSVRAPWRGHGVGAALMDALEAHARSTPTPDIYLHAQGPVIEFYRRRGYLPDGEPFVEAGIPHLAMRLPQRGR
jgi:diguanylate cyclase (GGDEF)-like protein